MNASVPGIVLLVLASALGGCSSGADPGPSPTPSPSSSLPTLAVQPPSDAPHVQPVVTGTLTLSSTNCFALGDPTTIVYAPHSAVVSPDGGGFIVGGREYRLGDPVEGLSGEVLPFETVPDPSPVLIACQPTDVAMLFQD